MYRPIQFVNFQLFLAVVLLLGFISFQAHGQERICPDGKRSYFGVCPDDGNQSRPLPVPEPRPVPPQRKSEPTAGSVIKDCTECPDMVVIPAGSFVMGSEKNSDEKPPHTVTVRSFLMGKTEVTQQQWEKVMGRNPSLRKDCGPDCPVESIPLDDIQKFINRLNQTTLQKYRLPSEAEWEYAARAGTTTQWAFGDDESTLSSYGWYEGNSGGRIHEVGQKLPNAFGLFDMHGNVWEITEDCWHDNYVGAPQSGVAWKGNCNERVRRGGSWSSGAKGLRSAFRSKATSYVFGNHAIGFRLARDL